MATNEFSPPRVAKIAEQDAQPASYRMVRPIKFDGVVFAKGEAVEFNDKKIETLFLKNNYTK